MAITRPDFEGISVADLQELVDAGATESQTLEFKSAGYGNADADKKELLKDVSSFANTHGGHLIVGVDSVEAVATAVPGIPPANIAAEILPYEATIRTGIEPRILGLKIKPVPLPAGNRCVVIRIPQSWNLPHRVTFQRWNKFFVRHSAGVDEANMDELRNLFTLGVASSDRIRAFHGKRIAGIIAGQGARPLVGNGRMVAHIAPLVSFTSRYECDLTRAHDAQEQFRPITSMGYTPQYNLDGFINERGGDQNHGYTQVFRNGTVEACRGNLIFQGHSGASIYALDMEHDLLEALVNYLHGLQNLDVPPPFAILVSLQGVDRTHYQLRQHPGLYVDGVPVFDRDTIALPEVLIEAYGTDADYRRAMIPALSILWNAMRRPRDEYFDDTGNWIGEGR